MKGITQVFYGTTEEWEDNSNPLYKGVFGVEVRQNGKRVTKVGDGETPWPQLPTIEQEAITDEANIRAAADSTLQGNIDAEAQTRSNADEQLQGNINAEAQTRADADSTLQGNIDAEAETRGQADEQLQENIDTEAETRGNADTTLQGNIDAEAEILQGNIDTEAQARQNADSTLQGNIEGEAQTLQSNINSETQAREYGDDHLQDNIDAEAETREYGDVTLQGNIDAEAQARSNADSGKIDKAAAGDPGTLLQSITIKEDTTNSVIVTGWSRNVNTPADAIPDDVPLPMASEERAGIMPAESFSQIEENTARIGALEGRSRHYPVTLDSETPTQEELQDAYEAASGSTGAAADQTTLDDTAFGKSYTYYENSATWVDRGPSIVTQFTNNSMGAIKGSNAPGKIFAEEDGTGSMVGYDGLVTGISNLGSGLQTEAQERTSADNGKVDKNGTDSLMSAAEHTKLDGIQTGAQVNPGAATTSAAGLMSAADKTKLNGIETGAQVNPGNATSSATGLMSSTDKAKLDGISAGAQVNPGAATTSAAGLMSAADKTKLNGIAAGAQVNPGNATQSAAGLMSAADKKKLDEYFDLEHPVGSLVKQLPTETSPNERGWPGSWVDWSQKASFYAIAKTSPTTAFLSDWRSKREDVWLLNTDGTVATSGTKKYSKPSGYVIVDRQTLQSNWQAVDLAEQASLTYNGSTYYIWQVIAFAGTFFGVDDAGYTGGGKRPTFGSGGKQADRIRPITGSHYPSGSGGEYSPVYTGAYKAGTITGQYLTGGGSGANIPVLDISLVHPVGADVAPVNTSMRVWRRTA